jgi:3-methyladenine DNA glycosylase AlkC
LATTLKSQYGIEVAQRLAEQISVVWPAFKERAFIAAVSQGYEALEFMDRAKHIARCFSEYLPQDFLQAADVLEASLGPVKPLAGDWGMRGFDYAPHGYWVAQAGIKHFDRAMQFQHALTQRFTAEWSIRPYLDHYPQQALALLQQWTSDPSVHVRRLVSEGTRPRLPWAPRLQVYDAHQTRIVQLLEALRDDEQEYVRRSVANHLNDIGKSSPELLLQIASKWLKRSTCANRKRLVSHALRSLVKQGHPQAMTLLGFAPAAKAKLINASLSTTSLAIGQSISFTATLSLDPKAAWAIDYTVGFCKANGQQNLKVFKGTTIASGHGGQTVFSKTIKLVQLSTRKLYPGVHSLGLLVNGQPITVGEFELLP